MSWVSLVLVVLALAVLVTAEWPRLEQRLGVEARRRRQRAKRKATLRVVRSESEEFAASVERDLARLPTISEREENGRR